MRINYLTFSTRRTGNGNKTKAEVGLIEGIGLSHGQDVYSQIEILPLSFEASEES